jgi:hypothetical protein
MRERVHRILLGVDRFNQFLATLGAALLSCFTSISWMLPESGSMMAQRSAVAAVQWMRFL